MIFLTTLFLSSTAVDWKCEYDIDLLCLCYKCDFYDNAPIYVKNDHIYGKTNADVKKFNVDREVTSIPRNLFENFPNIEEFIINLNQIKIIDGNYYTFPAEKLKTFSGAFNLLSELGALAFDFARNLKKITLNYNKINVIDNAAFKNLRQLEKVDLSSNAIAAIQKDWFQDLENLKTLKLGSNRITQLPANLLLQNLQLKSFVLTKNQIVGVDPRAIQQLPNGCVIHLYNNTCIHDSFIKKKSANLEYRRNFFNKIKQNCNLN